MVIKRFLDFILSVILLILLSPLFVIISFLILLTRRNPIFHHNRIGKNGQIFKVYKFQTMLKNSDQLLTQYLEDNPYQRKEWIEKQKLSYDPRITRIGLILRKYSLDELPQLINVFIGNMSFIGPRPIVKEEIEKYGKHFDTFIKAKSGISGLWQVSGRNDTTYKQRVEYDIYYINNWTLFLDIRIFFKTFYVILIRKGAY